MYVCMYVCMYYVCMYYVCMYIIVYIIANRSSVDDGYLWPFLTYIINYYHRDWCFLKCGR